MAMPKFVKEKANTGVETMTVPVRPAGSNIAPPAQTLGPRQTPDGLMLVASFPQAKNVCVAGDFNNWKCEKNPMRKGADGTWQVRLNLSKGIHRYRYVVDGQWQQDPHNTRVEPNPYGQMNSVLEVR